MFCLVLLVCLFFTFKVQPNMTLVLGQYSFLVLHLWLDFLLLLWNGMGFSLLLNDTSSCQAPLGWCACLCLPLRDLSQAVITPQLPSGMQAAEACSSPWSC